VSARGERLDLRLSKEQGSFSSRCHVSSSSRSVKRLPYARELWGRPRAPVRMHIGSRPTGRAILAHDVPRHRAQPGGDAYSCSCRGVSCLPMQREGHREEQMPHGAGSLITVAAPRPHLPEHCSP
jgi:hypothetical protein